MTLTAFVVAKIMNPAHSTHTQNGGSHPGESARVKEIVRETFVVTPRIHARPKLIASVM